MDKAKKEQGKRCFIITPIGDEKSDTFRKAKGVIESVIKPVLKKYGFDDIKPAYEIMESGMIGNQIIDRIINDDLVIANLTGNNPNVMYELAIRHAIKRPVIHICEKGTELPFDIKDNRISFYKDDMLGVRELQNEFESYVLGIDYSREYIDNPIYSGMEMANILKKIGDDGRQTEAELLQKILDKVSNTQSNKHNEFIPNTNIANKFEDAEFFIQRNAERGDEALAFLREFKEAEKKNSLVFLGADRGCRYYKNEGKLTVDEIEQMVNEISDKYDSKMLFGYIG